MARAVAALARALTAPDANIFIALFDVADAHEVSRQELLAAYHAQHGTLTVYKD